MKLSGGLVGIVGAAEDFFKRSSANTQWKQPRKVTWKPTMKAWKRRTPLKYGHFWYLCSFSGVNGGFPSVFNIRFQAVYGFVSSTLLRCWLPLNQSYAWAWSHRQPPWRNLTPHWGGTVDPRSTRKWDPNLLAFF